MNYGLAQNQELFRPTKSQETDVVCFRISGQHQVNICIKVPAVLAVSAASRQKRVVLRDSGWLAFTTAWVEYFPRLSNLRRFASGELLTRHPGTGAARERPVNARELIETKAAKEISRRGGCCPATAD
jgi:hypothetical protein